ncbi:hypothetical protein DMUE_5577 [Dictyocoela muelleri]|nr:hypothetical protein DMUE_5577 [Dictyocoela muelleri]
MKYTLFYKLLKNNSFIDSETSKYHFIRSNIVKLILSPSFNNEFNIKIKILISFMLIYYFKMCNKRHVVQKYYTIWGHKIREILDIIRLFASNHLNTKICGSPTDYATVKKRGEIMKLY